MAVGKQAVCFVVVAKVDSDDCTDDRNTLVVPHESKKPRNELLADEPVHLTEVSNRISQSVRQGAFGICGCRSWLYDILCHWFGAGRKGVYRTS